MQLNKTYLYLMSSYVNLKYLEQTLQNFQTVCSENKMKLATEINKNVNQKHESKEKKTRQRETKFELPYSTHFTCSLLKHIQK